LTEIVSQAHQLLFPASAKTTTTNNFIKSLFWVDVEVTFGDVGYLPVTQNIVTFNSKLLVTLP